MSWVVVGIVVAAFLGLCWIGDRRRGNELNPFTAPKDMTTDPAADEARFVPQTTEMQRGNDIGASL